MNKTYGIIAAVWVGICLALQPPVNANAGKFINSKNAALNSIFVSLITMLVIILVSGNIKEYTNITKVPILYRFGGLLGVSIVFGSILAVSSLGALTSASIFVSTQLILSAAINHFGLFGINKSPLTLTKGAGITLLI